MNTPTHAYRFQLFPVGTSPIPTECIVIYKLNKKLEENSLEKIARTVIAQATYLWLQGENQCLDSEMNMAAFRCLFTNEEDAHISQILANFNSLTIDNDYRTMGAPEFNNVRIRLE